MLVIFGVFLLIAACRSAQPTIITRSDPNQIDIHFNTPIGNFIYPTIDPNIAEDATLTTPQLITKYGYTSEVHFLTTEDGYILQLHRITGGEKSPPANGKKVAYVQHGLLDSSASFVLSGPNHALAYRLADEGYDVWFGNSRGNVYSTNHTTLNPYGSSKARKEFWSFSWHEIGMIDIPTSIDFVLNKTGQTKLQYIAHSQGTTAFFVMSSLKPEYNLKVEMMHALGPVAFLSHAVSPAIRAISPFVTWVERLSSLLGIDYIAPSDTYLKLAGEDLCRDRAPTQIICENLLFLIMGYTSDQLNATLLPVIFGHVPAGSSVNQLVHFGQEVDSGHFRQFDHGRIGNFKHYRQFSPPDYNLNNIKVPVALYYGKDDWLADVKDVEKLAQKLPNVIKKYMVPHDKFNHVDFLWGKDTPRLVYDELVQTMKSTEIPQPEKSKKNLFQLLNVFG